MLSLILRFIKNAWNKWNITGFVLLGLSLQIFLLFTASLRKKTASRWVIWPIWSFYLLADWAASFAVGLIFDSEKRYTSGPMDDNGLLLVLWTPFLLLFVGGQYRISSFAVEDNEFWLRHLIWLILQVFTTGYVFIRSLPQNRLWIPTLLLLLAGIIKYAERTSALYLASSDSLGISVLGEPDPGADYEKLMNAYSCSQNNNLPTRIVRVPRKEPRDLENKLNNTSKKDKLENQELVQCAYHFSNIYKALIVNLMFTSREHKESREFFSKRNAVDTLRVLEIELNFFYDVLHTKVVVTHSKLGKISWCISIGLVVAALSLFLKEEKQGFKSSDVTVTYTLFFGALGLDMVNLLIWAFSDWTIASLESFKKDYSLTNILSRFINMVIDLRMSSWNKESVWTTKFIFQRWSASLSQFNFIEYCLKKSPKIPSDADSRHMMTIILDRIITFICYVGDMMFTYLGIKNYIDQKKNDMSQTRYVSSEPLPEKLWELIFTELRQKSELADDPEIAKEISSARGEWVLVCGDISIDCSCLMPYVKDVAYDESLLLWHIATELCYNTYDENDDHRNLSKYISHYMLYLLYQLPGMMSEVPGIAKIRFKDTCAEAKRFFSKREQPLAEVMKWACGEILAVNTDMEPVDVKGDRSKSVLFDACILAKKIGELKEEKWKVMTKVWVELLSYAASRSRAYAHIQQLSKGGELLTFVWLLMAHFGLREHALVRTRTRKLMIGK